MGVRLVAIELRDLSRLPDGAVRRFDGVDLHVSTHGDTASDR